MDVFNIYLAGGMTGLTIEEQNNWRTYVIENLRYKTSRRINCFNPVMYYSIEDSTIENDKEAMIFDLYKLSKSDLLIVNFNSVYSLGTMAEIAIAYSKGIHIIGINENNSELHPWQINMVTKMFNDIDDAIEYTAEYYLNS